MARTNAANGGRGEPSCDDGWNRSVYLVRNAEPAVAGSPAAPGVSWDLNLTERTFGGRRVGEEASGIYVLGRLVPQDTVYRALVAAAVVILIFLFFPRRRDEVE